MPGSSLFPIEWPALLGLVLCCGVLHAQTSYKVEAQKTLNIQMPGATAAYALDPTYADASADNGVVTVSGKIAGTTHVVVVTASGALPLEIHVTNPPPRLPPGLLNPFHVSSGIESGFSESRYNSNPSQVQTTLDLSRRDGQTTIRTHIVATRQLEAVLPGQTRTSVSSAYYQISTPRREITLLDELLDESRLGVNGAIVRGIHIRQDGWFLHAGYTSIASFEGLFLPTRPESVVEVGYRHALSADSSLSGSVYRFGVPASDSVGRSGYAGVVTYAKSRGENFKFTADLGVSRGVSAAASVDYRGAGDQFRADIRFAPSTFASLGTNNLRGLQADLSWSHSISRSLTSDLTLYSTRFSLPGLRQSSMTAGERLQYRLGGHWSIFGGFTGSIYGSAMPPRPPARNLSAPAGLSFSSRYFGAQGQYQFSRASRQDVGGHQYRASVRGGAGPFSVSAFAEMQTQAPTLSFILDQARGLEQALAILGVQATTIQQVDEILRENSYLFTAGYVRGATVNLSPVRSQVGGSAALLPHGRRKPQLTYNFLFDDNHGLMGTTLSSVHTLLYTQRLGAEEFSFSYSLAGIKSPGLVPIYRPVFTVAWRHQLQSVPSFLIPERHGFISGVVFRDDDSKGGYEPGMPRMAGAEVVLDGVRRVATGADGSYRFSRVPVGRHRLSVSYRSDKPTFFSTQSEVEISETATVHFGIGFTLSGLVGRIASDAGAGIPGAAVTIRSAGNRWPLTSDGDGGFFLRRLPEGSYEVEIDPDSIPAGYLTSELEPTTVAVGATAPGHAVFSVKALRSIGGRVYVLDGSTGRTSPVPNRTVTLKGAGKTATTDASGRYLFRNLPAGSYTVAVADGSTGRTRAVTLPAGPLTLTNVDFQVSRNGIDLPPAAPADQIPDPPDRAAAPASQSPKPLAPPPAEQPSSPPPPPDRAELDRAAREHDRLCRQKLGAMQYQPAIAECDEAIRLSPGYAPAYNARGFTWYKLYRLSDALADLDRAILLNPDYANAYHNRSVVRKAAGDLSGAESDRREENRALSRSAASAVAPPHAKTPSTEVRPGVPSGSAPRTSPSHSKTPRRQL